MTYNDLNDDRAEQLFDKAISFYHSGKYDKSLSILNDLLEHQTDYIEEWNIHEFIGLCYFYREMFIKSINHLEKALNKINPKEDIVNYLIISRYIGMCYFRIENYHRSLESYKMMTPYLDQLLKHGRHYDLFFYYLGISRALHQIGDMEESKEEIINAILVAKEHLANHDEDLLNLAYVELSELYSYLHEYAEALRIADKVEIEKCDNYTAVKHLTNLAHIYLCLNNNKKVIELCYHIIENYDMEDFKSFVYLYLAKVYFRESQLGEATTYLDKLKDIPKKPQWIIDAIKSLKKRM